MSGTPTWADSHVHLFSLEDEGAALDRTRRTQMPWAVVQLRFD